MPRRVIIDTDPGIDDMMAIFLALASPELTVEGITIVHGNHYDLDLLARNACLALTICGRADVKVIKGEPHSLARKSDRAGALAVHGQNGIGEIEPPAGFVDTRPLEHAVPSAARFMVDTCAKYPGEVTIIALGPLTNLAKAIQLDDGFSENVMEISLMGGVLNGRGNITPCTEANIRNDPEAAKLVFAKLSKGIGKHIWPRNFVMSMCLCCRRRLVNNMLSLKSAKQNLFNVL